MKEIGSTTFGYVIAFLLPGLIGLYGLGLWVPPVQMLLLPVTSMNATVGPSFFLLLTALALGLVIAAIRHLIWQKWFCKSHRLKDEGFRVLMGERLTAFRAAAEEHYRYHQFYGGVCLAIAPAFLNWLWLNWRNSLWQTTAAVCAFTALEFLLAVTAAGSLGLYTRRGNQILDCPPEKAT